MIKTPKNSSSIHSELEPEPNVWWQEAAVWKMLFLGFSAGIPIYLIFSSLSLWLREAGLDRSTVTYFSWAVLGYSFKFLWAPLIDRLPVPFLTKRLGRRRGWLLVAQVAVILSIALMGMTDPQKSLALMAWGAVLLGFASATQDIVIDAYRIEIIDKRYQAMLASTYTAGYRVGMIVAGSGALFLAQWFGSDTHEYRLLAWQQTYFCMAAVMLVGVITTFFITEPVKINERHPHETKEYINFFFAFLLSVATFVIVLYFLPATPKLFSTYGQLLFGFVFSAVEFLFALAAAFMVAKSCHYLGLINQVMLHDSYQAPIKDFFMRYGKLAIWILLLIGVYRISDIVLGVITNVFYQDMGYSKAQIASISKGFGVAVTIAGSFLGGFIALRLGVMRTLMIAGILVILANLSFMCLANIDPNTSSQAKTIYLIALIVIDNLTQGLSIVAFIAWMSSLTNIEFTATQYALFSSLMTLIPKLIGGFSGAIVDAIGYTYFFLFASALGVPVLFLIYYLGQHLELKEPQKR